MSKQNNYTMGEILREIRKLDVNNQSMIYQAYNMSQLLEIINSEEKFMNYINNLLDLSKQYKALADSLAKVKTNLDKGEKDAASEDITSAIVGNYMDLSESKQKFICDKLGLIRLEDIPEPKEEPITMDRILKAYDLMSDNEKVYLDKAFRKHDSMGVALKKFGETWKEFVGNKE